MHASMHLWNDPEQVKAAFEVANSSQWVQITMGNDLVTLFLHDGPEGQRILDDIIAACQHAKSHFNMIQWGEKLCPS